jgi:outer membrane protein OmpA-like peptidoglycan-associated protein
MAETEANSGKITENSTAITTLQSGVANALNYQLVDKTDVMFAFNKSTLTPDGKRSLDEIVSKAQTMPRSVIEIAGFADPVGSKGYNLALSRRRAEAVQRYLVDKKVPLRSIHIAGFGDGATPSEFEPETAPSGSKAQRHQAERRAQVRLFGAGDLAQGSAERQQ